MGKQPGRWEPVTTKDFNIEFLRELKAGQILKFHKNDEDRYWKVARVDKKRHVWWLQPWRLYTDEEFRALERMRVG
jgi:RIO-like serine/threonine protein kinase